MIKVICLLLTVLCGLASINVSFAEPSTTYGAAPAKYPAAPPATYPATPPKYEAPPPPAPPAPPAKYETPTPSEKPKYEEMKKEEYPMKMEYKKEEKMPEYGGGKKYRRSIVDDEEEEEVHSDPSFRSNRLSKKEVKAVRDAVIMKLLSENDPSFSGSTVGKGSRKESAGFSGSFSGSKIGGDPYSTVNDPGFLSSVGNAVKWGANFFRNALSDDRACRIMGLSRKQAKLVRDAVIVAAENDPGFGKKFGKALAKESAGSFSDYRGGDPFSVQDLVEMYGRDPQVGYIPIGPLASGLSSLFSLFKKKKSRDSDPFSVTVQDLVEMYGRDPAIPFAAPLAPGVLGDLGKFVGKKSRGSDPFPVTVQDLVEMYGRDPAKGKQNWKFNRPPLLADDEEIFMDDMIDF